MPQANLKQELLILKDVQKERYQLAKSHVDKVPIGKLTKPVINGITRKRITTQIYDKFGKKTEQEEEHDITDDPAVALAPIIEIVRTKCVEEKKYYTAQLEELKRTIELCDKNLALATDIETLAAQVKTEAEKL